MNNEFPHDPHTLDASRVAGNFQAPKDERLQAQVEVADSVAKYGAAKIYPQDMMVKAFAETLKADEEIKRLRNRGKKTGRIDELSIFRQFDYLQRPAPLGFSALRTLPTQLPILASIIFGFIREESQFLHRSNFDYQVGYKLKFKKQRGGPLSDTQQKRLDYVDSFLQNAGSITDPFERDYLDRDNLHSYFSKFMFDSLILDHGVTEILRNGDGDVDGFAHVDGGTIYLAPKEGMPDHAQPPINQDDVPEREYVKAIEVDEANRPLTWLAYGQIKHEVRNPRPDIFGRGYGMSEAEFCVRAITGLLNLMTYNDKSYNDNHIPPLILQLFGGMNDADKNSFKSYWNSMLSGVTGNFELPVLFTENKDAGAIVTKLKDPPQDMAYIKYQTLLYSMLCSVYGKSPESIELEGFSSKSSSLSDGSVDSKIQASKDKSLIPHLKFLARHFNDLIDLIDEAVDLEFCGLVTAEESWTRDQKALTWSELRTRQGLEPSGNPVVDNAPIDPGMQQIYQMTLNMHSQGFGNENLSAQQPYDQQQSVDSSHSEVDPSSMEQLHDQMNSEGDE
jgi:hypothetical protein